ncbi:type-F conjugative transfer system protein TraW [Asticcacaulis excentricus]|uniref:Type-F conjugative transfer system protein TraW n=1 Tax=Asticcacaulis excentricus (strain ATCC 15261 / DSM 4724 / KCTC 12464 / NCIMB 9791 / VKM B-1370 / CB 48) TaxID=573065 RepID=E8RVY1_ASTEC|nr:type-F conjugative transfer system protein TraW [Asticcacaulis excentricus]ADU15403.1 type-F conjugative transfer system protein TraW [Asticcacaulis excentricus CB 48]
MGHVRASLFIAMTICACLPAQAGDLGAYGPTFEIIETDLLKDILSKLRKAEKDGRIDELNRKFADATRKRVESPPPVPGIVTTVKTRTWLYDPSIVVPQEIADDKGRVFARRGERINPLERLPSYNKVLIFIDGRDARQVEFAVAQSKKLGQDRTIMVLVNGSPMATMRARKQAFYFDQLGTLTTKFGITQVPATVTKEGTALRVREVAL